MFFWFLLFFQQLEPVLDLDTRPASSFSHRWLAVDDGFYFVSAADQVYFLPNDSTSPQDLGRMEASALLGGWSNQLLLVQGRALFVLNRDTQQLTPLIEAFEAYSFGIEFYDAGELVWLVYVHRLTGKERVLSLDKATFTLTAYGELDPYHEFRVQGRRLWAYKYDELWLADRDAERMNQVSVPGPSFQIRIHAGEVYLETSFNFYRRTATDWQPLSQLSRIDLIESGQTGPQYFGNGKVLGYTDGTPSGTKVWLPDTRYRQVAGLEWNLPFAILLDIRGDWTYLRSFAKHQTDGVELFQIQGLWVMDSLLGNSAGLWFSLRQYNELGNPTSTSLYFSDGTQAGTFRLVREIGSDLTLQPVGIFQDKAFFLLGDGRDEFRLWVSDGSAVGTHLAETEFPHTGTESYDLNMVRNAIGFAFLGQSDDWGREPVFGNGGAIRRWADLTPGSENELGPWTVVGDRLYAAVGSAEFGRELASIEKGQVQVFDFAPQAMSSQPAALHTQDDRVYASFRSRGQPSFWRLDGDSAEPLEAAEAHLAPDHFFDHDGLLYFLGNSGCAGRELWQTDGSPEGQTFLKEYTANHSDGPYCYPESSSLDFLGRSGPVSWLTIWQSSFGSGLSLYRMGPADNQPQKVELINDFTLDWFCRPSFAVSSQGIAFVMGYDEQRALYLLPREGLDWQVLAPIPLEFECDLELFQTRDGYLLKEGYYTLRFWFLANGETQWQPVGSTQKSLVGADFRPDLSSGYLQLTDYDQHDQILLFDGSQLVELPLGDWTLDNLKLLGSKGLWTYFAADHPQYGRELFRVHRLVHQIQLVSDLVEGPQDSNPERIMFGETVLFVAANLDQSGYTLFELPFFPATAGPNQRVCDVETQLSASPAQGHWEILAGKGGVVAPTQNPRSLFVGQPGEHYLLAWRFQDDQGFEDERTVSIQMDALQHLSGFQTQMLCSVETTLQADPVQSGYGKWEVRSGQAKLANPYAAISIVWVPISQAEPVELVWRGYPADCVSGESVVVLERQPLIESDQVDRLICGTQTQLDGVLPAGATGHWSIETGVGGVLSDPTDPHALFSGLEGHRYYLRWSVNDERCGQREIQITLQLGQSGSISGPERAHPNQTIRLEAPAGGVAYHWSDGSRDASLTFTFTQPIRIWVDVEMPDGCIQRFEHFVQFNPYHER
ncbi:MAG: hypothetical protein H6510_12555 [Acidobacteria bacterium]|nr:hypothetical protein [Acidobacteriota bacterium]MCB9398637.1 hypothetical protein [Acidobacteriota bacterium]